MLHYPKMPGSEKAPLGKRCVAFEKLDGTNLHFCFEKEFGWHSFGTRRDRFSLSAAGVAAFGAAHPELSEVSGAWSALEAAATEAVEALEIAEATLFCEFLGDGSFAGKHRTEDEKRLAAFDVLTPDGFLAPEEFLSACVGLPTPRVVYRGKLTGQLTHDVRQGKFDVYEGVVCKGTDGSWRCKVKTDAYLARLKAAFQDDWEAYWE